MRTFGKFVLAAAVIGGLGALAPVANAAPMPHLPLHHQHNDGPWSNDPAFWGVEGGNLANSIANPRDLVSTSLANT